MSNANLWQTRHDNASNGSNHHKNGRKRQRREFSALELCAGGGGAALGLEQAGFYPAVLLDNDAHSCATLRSNRPYWNVIEADIRRFDASYWQDVDLVSGGLPCPPFSIAGKQLGEEDERNLFPAMLRIVKTVRPRAVLIENVRGILAPRFASFRQRVDEQLSALGFDTYWAGFNAADFGVPQIRFRAFLVALNRAETKPLVWPVPPRPNRSTVGETIYDLMAAREWHAVHSWATKASKLAPTIVGGSHKHGGPDLGPTRARNEWAQLGVDGLGVADKAPDRDFAGMPRLTVAMVARLQSFPDDWKFAGTKTQAYRQVGNALPVALAHSVATSVRRCLE